MYPLLISIAETGSMLGLGRTKIYELLNSGELNSARVGGRRLVEFASAERFARECLGTPISGGRDASSD